MGVVKDFIKVYEIRGRRIIKEKGVYSFRFVVIFIVYFSFVFFVLLCFYKEFVFINNLLIVIFSCFFKFVFGKCVYNCGDLNNIM